MPAEDRGRSADTHELMLSISHVLHQWIEADLRRARVVGVIGRLVDKIITAENSVNAPHAAGRETLSQQNLPKSTKSGTTHKGAPMTKSACNLSCPATAPLAPVMD